MFNKKKSFFNWGRNIKINPTQRLPRNLNELKKLTNKKSFIITGNQRSFGDAALNNKLIISMKNFNRILSKDYKRGVIELESGVLLKDILPIVVKNGWFFPVTPGTKYVSLGGMVANNVHGKNTTKNQIKFYIKEIKLLTLKKKVITCSPKKNKKVFYLTIGGFGLTGIILSVKLKLKKISSPYLSQKIIEFNSFTDFFKKAKEINKFQYSVSWIDNFTNNKISGLWFLSNHINIKKDNYRFKKFSDKQIDIISFLVLKLVTSNLIISRISNFVYKKYKKLFHKKIVYYDECFYPQDYFIDWNKAYGNKGMFQFQFLVPEKKFKFILSEIFYFFKKEKLFSSFVVIKKINEKGNYLNYVGNGYSISLDFIINNKFDLLKVFLNKIINDNDLKVNFAKDFITNETNAYNYKKFIMFKKDIFSLNYKRKINSLLSKRINI